MSNHTPGPWAVEKVAPDEWQINSDLRDYCLFEMTPRIGLKVLTKEDKANATLIAAAPEMLESLQEIFNSSTVEFSNEQWKKYAAVIAKATGVQQ